MSHRTLSRDLWSYISGRYNTLPYTTEKVGEALPNTVDAPSPDRLAGIAEHLVGDFARHGHTHEVRFPGIPETVYVVPTIAEAERLASQGVSRGRIWTGRELGDLIETRVSAPDFAAVALAKIALDGEMVETRRRNHAVTSSPPHPAQNNDSTELGLNSNPPQDPSVAGLKIDANHRNNCDLARVAGQNPEIPATPENDHPPAIPADDLPFYEVPRRSHVPPSSGRPIPSVPEPVEIITLPPPDRETEAEERRVAAEILRNAADGMTPRPAPRHRQ